MKVYWPRAVATKPEYVWDFQLWIPDLVIVLLGSNDYYNWPYPSDEAFINGYINLLTNIVNSYNVTSSPSNIPTIINLCGGVLENNRAPCANVQKASNTFASTKFSRTHYIEISSTWLSYPQD